MSAMALPPPGLRWARTGRLTGRPWEIVRVTDDARVMLLDEASWILAESVVEWGAPLDSRPVAVALPQGWTYEVDARFDCVHYCGPQAVTDDSGCDALRQPVEITIFHSGIIHDVPRLAIHASTLHAILTFHIQRNPR